MENELQTTSEIKVSVIMPIFNAGEYLARAISDVLGQTLADIELICIDDGSTDNSLSILKSFKEQDTRLRIVTENNAGPSIARNKGLVRARGKYLICLDADDFYEKNLLELLYNAAERNNLDIAVAKFDIYNEEKDSFSQPLTEPHSSIFDGGAVTSKSEYPEYILRSTTGYVWNKLFKTSFVRDKELSFNTELYVFEDVHFVCTSIALAERVGRVDDILIHHRVYSEQSRARLFRKYYGQVPVVYKKIKEFLMQKGMYIPLYNAFLNLSAGRCYKIYNLLWSDGKEKLWDMLHSQYATELDWFNHEKTDFESSEVCEFVANVGVYTHAEYLARTEKGRNLDIDRLDQKKINKKIKRRETGRRFKSLFTRKKK